MKILSFDELQKISKEDIMDSKNMLIDFLENHHKISFAGIYGGVAMNYFDKFSDIDVFVIYSDFSFLEELKIAYIRGQFGKADIEWQLIPEFATRKGIAKEKNYFETVQNNHKYITGAQEIFLDIEIDQNPLEMFLLSKITKISDYYIKNEVNIDILSKMLRAIGHIPSKMVSYTGNSKTEVNILYSDLMNDSDSSLLESWKKIYNLPNEYKRMSQSVMSEEDYSFLVLKIHNEVFNYIDWLQENYFVLNQKALQL